MDSICPACHTRESELVETVPVSTLAALWAKERSHGEGTDVKRLNKYIVEDLCAEEVSFRQCKNCNLEVATPMRSWSAAHYPHTKHTLGFDHETTLAALASLSPRRVLDIGCADGQFLEAAKALGHEPIGIDFTVMDVRSAQARGINAHVADVSEIAKTFAGVVQFDVITLFQVIEHLNEPDEIFSQIASITGRDSLLFIGYPCERRYTRLYFHPNRVDRSDFWDYPPQHTLRWNIKALIAFLARHGWAIEAEFPEPFQMVGAAAHISQLIAIERGWRDDSFRRKIETLRWLGRTAITHFFKNATGLRQLVRARRRL